MGLAMVMDLDFTLMNAAKADIWPALYFLDKLVEKCPVECDAIIPSKDTPPIFSLGG